MQNHWFLLGAVLLLGAIDVTSSYNVWQLARANGNFAFSLYDHVIDGHDGENKLFSPFSLSTALAMTYAGAKGETAAQMSEVLGFSNLTFNVHAVFLATLGSKDFTLALANGIFLDEGFSICPSFSELLAKYYIASARRLPFHDEPRISADAINDWVTYQTSYTIQEIVTTNDVADADFALMNAVYFGGLWKFPFDERRTRLATFDVSPLESVTVNMMVQTARLRFSYNRRLHSRILELPYEGDRLAMYIILPVQKNGLAALERKLSFGTVTSAIADLSRRRVPIAIPRFKMSVDENLPDILSDMGMNLAFTPAADFSGIASGVFITKVIHAAFIGMNEKGTEAAAATAVTGGYESAPHLRGNFVADHPFLFLIRDSRTGSILFLGRLVRPQQYDSK